eukprot:scaffold34_cov260-Pinguiococcus_pyrenoidosus.AAC.7
MKNRLEKDRKEMRFRQQREEGLLLVARCPFCDFLKELDLRGIEAAPARDGLKQKENAVVLVFAAGAQVLQEGTPKLVAGTPAIAPIVSPCELPKGSIFDPLVPKASDTTQSTKGLH